MAEIKVNVVKYADRKNLMMRFVDPITGKQSARSTRTTKRRDAERAAAKWEAELQEGRYLPDSKITWEEFRERYEEEKLSGLSDTMDTTTASAFSHVERIIAPKQLANLTPEVLSKFQASLRKLGLADASITTYLKHIRAALNWAHKMGLLSKPADIQMPKHASGRKLMRGRPITTEEFERMLAVAPSVRPNDDSVWLRYMTGLWISGLRLEESVLLSWDSDELLAVDFTGRHPRLRIYMEADKGREDRLLPLAPEFADFLSDTPASQRHGHVFRLGEEKQPTSNHVGRIVSEIGRVAGVAVDKKIDKCATTHDFRRSFGTRWAPRVKPITLQVLMRHKSIETTLKYYVSQDADDVADELRRCQTDFGNTLGNTALNPPIFGAKEKPQLFSE